MQVHIRSPRAGSSSHGYTWPHDGAVIPVDSEHAAELLRITHAGFEQVDAPVKAPAASVIPTASEPDEDESDDGPDETGQPRRRRRTTA